MPNLYSCTKPREAIIRLFKVSDNRAEQITRQPEINPSENAPAVRLGSDRERELVNLSWGFVTQPKGYAPSRSANTRDDQLHRWFWASSFRERRCLVPVTSFAESQGRSPATWHWFALDKSRPLFAFAGIWRPYKAPVRKDGETVEIDVYSFLTTNANDLLGEIDHTRMPVMLTKEEEWDTWLNGSPDEALKLVRSYPADEMMIVQSGADRQDLERK